MLLLQRERIVQVSLSWDLAARDVSSSGISGKEEEEKEEVEARQGRARWREREGDGESNGLASTYEYSPSFMTSLHQGSTSPPEALPPAAYLTLAGRVGGVGCMGANE
ncbi:hypothetical protein E2C01_089828 [Portunus trituberculatus]|uniref:Uncharacterized protein n=1 Tax=Portunus trituberculatus TaxID=210409 RepID=A0A5B7JD34_PORTR|nr:hypothetical protein [Portunus trituberculatus]